MVLVRSLAPDVLPVASPLDQHRQVATKPLDRQLTLVDLGHSRFLPFVVCARAGHLVAVASAANLGHGNHAAVIKIAPWSRSGAWSSLSLTVDLSLHSWAQASRGSVQPGGRWCGVAIVVAATITWS